jgi:hypothetical protein
MITTSYEIFYPVSNYVPSSRHIRIGYEQREAILDRASFVRGRRPKYRLQAADGTVVGECGCLAGDVLSKGDLDVASVVLAGPAIDDPPRLKSVNDPRDRAVAQFELPAQLAKRHCALRPE